MAILSDANLLIEINADVTAQTAPDSITPPILGGVLVNLVGSKINIDQMTTGSALYTWVMSLINSIVINNPGVNGQLGQFSVGTEASQLFYNIITNTDYPVLLLRDSDAGVGSPVAGSFDNGSNHNGTYYVVPVPGFVGKFYISCLTISIGVVPSTNETYELRLNKYDASNTFVSNILSVSFTNPSAGTVGAGINIPPLISATQTLSAGEKIRLDIRRTSATGVGAIQINSVNLDNLA